MLVYQRVSVIYDEFHHQMGDLLTAPTGGSTTYLAVIASIGTVGFCWGNSGCDVERYDEWRQNQVASFIECSPWLNSIVILVIESLFELSKWVKHHASYSEWISYDKWNILGVFVWKIFLKLHVFVSGRFDVLHRFLSRKCRAVIFQTLVTRWVLKRGLYYPSFFFKGISISQHKDF